MLPKSMFGTLLVAVLLAQVAPAEPQSKAAASPVPAALDLPAAERRKTADDAGQAAEAALASQKPSAPTAPTAEAVVAGPLTAVFDRPAPTGVIGDPIEFHAESVPGASFDWQCSGDVRIRKIGDGQSVLLFTRVPGKYTVFLAVSAEGGLATARWEVEILGEPPPANEVSRAMAAPPPVNFRALAAQLMTKHPRPMAERAQVASAFRAAARRIRLGNVQTSQDLDAELDDQTAAVLRPMGAEGAWENILLAFATALHNQADGDLDKAFNALYEAAHGFAPSR